MKWHKSARQDACSPNGSHVKTQILRLVPATCLVAIMFLLVAATQNGMAADSTTMWQQQYKHGNTAFDVQKTVDGGYILAGYSNKTSDSKNDGWYAKVDAEGKLQWSYVTDLAGNDTFFEVRQTSDRGFILAGYSTNSTGQRHALLMKIEENGKIEWARNFTGKGLAAANGVALTNAGGYAIVGQTATVNGTGTAFLIITDADGSQQGTIKEFDSGSTALGVQVTKDAGYVIVGELYTSYGGQLYLIKTDQSGNVVWEQSYGQTGIEIGYDVVQTKDGGYACAGTLNAYGWGGYDALLLKTDAKGIKEWERNFGNTTDDQARTLLQTNDGGYILGGYTDLTGRDTPTIYKSNTNGNYTWDFYWPSIQGTAYGVLETSDGNFVIAGSENHQTSAFLLETTPPTPPNPTPNGNNLVTWILGAVVCLGALGVVGTYYARRSKKRGYTFGGGEPSAGYAKSGETTDVGAMTAGALRTQQETQPIEERELSSPPSFPKELESRFSEVRYLGEGGFARVFSALDLKGAPVAVKVLKSRDPKAGKLFTTEAANWSVLRHENIVRLFDYNIFPIPYLESELCDSSIESEMSYGPLPVERAIELIKQVAYGLSYAHQRRILHGDIKPSNILIKDNMAKISDWGLSKLKTETSVSIAGVTLQYAAPEQLSREFGGADERTDIYQLGVLLYQCITARLPFADTESLVDTILRDEPAPPSQFRQISRELDDIILKCLKKRKGERYQNVRVLMYDLDVVASLPEQQKREPSA